jgi:hypothetical protein
MTLCPCFIVPGTLPTVGDGRGGVGMLVDGVAQDNFKIISNAGSGSYLDIVWPYCQIGRVANHLIL